MQTLYAPWRMDYVKRDPTTKQPNDCIFCDKPMEQSDSTNYIVQRGETCYTILNAFPYNNGHVMVIPYRHISHITELASEENLEMLETAALLTRCLDSIYAPHGYNIGMNLGSAAGAGIAAHLHLHIVPRWEGDTNFMPVIGDTKVLPELLAQSYQKLSETVKSLSKLAQEF